MVPKSMSAAAGGPAADDSPQLGDVPAQEYVVVGEMNGPVRQAHTIRDPIHVEVAHRLDTRADDRGRNRDNQAVNLPGNANSEVITRRPPPP